MIMNDLRAAAEQALTNYYDDVYSVKTYQFDIKRQVAHDLKRLTPTGNENVTMIREVWLFAEKESQRGEDSMFDMDFWFAVEGRSNSYLEYGVTPACGTTMCLAGTAAWMDLKPNEVMHSNYVLPKNVWVEGKQSIDKYVDSVYEGDFEGIQNLEIDQRGARSMGLNNDQANVLFYLTGMDTDTSQIIPTIHACLSYVAGEVL